MKKQKEQNKYRTNSSLNVKSDTNEKQFFLKYFRLYAALTFFLLYFYNFIDSKIINTYIILNIYFERLNPNIIHKMPLFGNNFPPIYIYCYNLSKRWQPVSDDIKDQLYKPNKNNFQKYLEIEFHHQLLLSPIYTKDPEKADLFFIPIYSRSIIYSKQLLNSDMLIQELQIIGPWYDRKHGTDHFILSIDIENIIRDIFLKTNIMICSSYPITNPWTEWYSHRNIVIPYLSSYPNISEDWNTKRNISIFVSYSYDTQKKFRKELSDQIQKVNNSKVIIFKRSNFSDFLQCLPYYYKHSNFCISTIGDTPTSKRFYDATYFGCIPLIISDDITLPFSGTYLDFTKFSIKIPQNSINNLSKIIENISEQTIISKRNELKKAAKSFRFRIGEPPRIGEGFWAICWMLYTHYLYLLPFNTRYLKEWN